MTPPPAFNTRIYALVRAIPPGKVLNYGRVAELLGVSNGAREVGWAMSSLPASQRDVPWHRVVNAQGRVSIKGSPVAAAEQRRRLEAEGIVFDDKDRLDLKQHTWDPAPWEVEEILRTAGLPASSHGDS
ncbi:MGMT family protein [Aggregatilinea lenta]|uniref:MGMT family protein n=1 Tax=Aggregatilinea lenta TaxID=913108 RepID=UPI000E5A3484|nr:MGMT family protein [Aggregatilinea lenta]